MKLIALDLDGTTLNSRKEMTEETIRVIKKAQQQGHIVMALSGRSEKSILTTLEKYDLNCPVGASNGTVLLDNEKLVELTPLNESQIQKLVLAFEKEYVPYNFTTNIGSFAPSNWGERLEKVLASGCVPHEYFDNQHYKMFTTHPSDYGHTLFEQVEKVINKKDLSIIKFLMLGLDPEQKKRLQLHLESIAEISIASSSPFNLEVTHINGNKGTGLKAMARYFNIPLEDTIAIGDEKNDIPMFNVAGLSIAMGNSEEEVKRYCDIVTLTNDENGVAYAIEKYILKDSYVL